MVGTLQRPRRADHAAVRRHAPRQCADRVGRNVGDRGRPVGVLRLAVGLAHQIRPQALEARCIAYQELFVVQPFRHQRVRERKQHRGVGVGPDRNPGSPGSLRSVIAHRAHIDDLDAGTGQLRHPAGHVVLAAAALGDLHVLGIGAAEQQHKPAVPRDRRP